MGETKFTLVELHLDGDTQFGLGSIGSALPFGSSPESAETPEYETETDIGTDESEEESSSKALGALVALVVLVGIAAAAKRYRGGDDEPSFEAEEEPDVIVN